MKDKVHEQINLLVGVDRFGRCFTHQSATKNQKKVGIFFWLWIGQPYASGVYDAGKILEMKNGRKILFEESSDISPDGQQHFWGEPLWGYYNSEDEWVIRKQIELLMLAGVDFIVFDATNALTYKNVYQKVLATIEAYQNAGWNPPQAAFYTHSYSMKTVMTLYEELYSPGLYSNTWYREDGKPMIVGYTNPEEDKKWALAEMHDALYDPSDYPQEVMDFFCFKKPQWPLDPFLEDGFPWIEWTFPQPVRRDMMSVSVASHPRVPFSFSLTRGWENWGRGWDVDAHKNCPEEVDRGAFFQSQWEHAIKTDPNTVFVGGWNEWIAYKQLWDGEYMLCDAVNKEFSRDIEPMAGGYEDSFYIQLIQNIRRYKGICEDGKSSCGSGEITYESTALPLENRSFFGVSRSIRYCNYAPQNIIQKVQVSHDQDMLQFSIICEKDITKENLEVLSIFIGVGVPHIDGWAGYDYRVGNPVSDNACKLFCLLQNETSCIGTVPYVVDGSRILYTIPRMLLHKAKSNMIYFKVSLAVDDPENILCYYISGSVLPPGRLSYAYLLGETVEGSEISDSLKCKNHVNEGYL